MSKKHLILAAISLFSSASLFAGDPVKTNGNNHTTVITGMPPVLPSGNYWQVGGNNANPSDWLGTQNNQPLVFKVNNTQQMAILTNGNVQINSLAASGTTGVVTYDAKGELLPVSFTGNSTDVLTGNGTFTSFASLSPWTDVGYGIWSKRSVSIGGLPSTTNAFQVYGNANVTGTISAANFNISNSISTPVVVTGRVKELPGDSIIHFGDSSIVMDVMKYNIYSEIQPIFYTQAPRYFGIALGYNNYVNTRYPSNTATTAVAIGSGNHIDDVDFQTAIMGYNNIITGAGDAMVIGTGLTNNISGSIMIGNSGTNKPAITVLQDVSGSTGGNVGINTKAPVCALDVSINSPSIVKAGTGINKIILGGSINPYEGNLPYPIESYVGFNLIGDANGNITGEGDGSTYNGGSMIFCDGNGNLGIGTPYTTPNNGANYTKNGGLAPVALFSEYGLVINATPGTQDYTAKPCMYDPAQATQNGKYILAVNGSIRAVELLIQPPAWCDYVFDKNYKLPSLEFVNNYIKENGHLPDVPSSNEVKNRGIEQGEMDVTFLKKIEELTLYTIKLQKQLDDMKALKDEVDELKTQLAKQNDNK